MIGHIGLAMANIGVFPFRKAGILPVGFFLIILIWFEGRSSQGLELSHIFILGKVFY